MKDNKVNAKKHKKQKRLYKFLYWLLAGLVRKLYRVRVINQNNEPIDTNFILASNHTAAADAVIIAASMKKQIRFMGKKELFKVPVVGSLLRAIGSYPVDRKGSDVSALRTTLNLLKEKDCIGIFPQGTRCPKVDPATTKVKHGVGLIAARSGAPVLPVCVKSNGGAVKMFKKNYLVIGQLMKNEDFDFENNKGAEGYQRVADKIHAEICKLYAETDITNAK